MVDDGGAAAATSESLVVRLAPRRRDLPGLRPRRAGPRSGGRGRERGSDGRPGRARVRSGSGSARRSSSCPRSTATCPGRCRSATRGSPSRSTRHGGVRDRLRPRSPRIHAIDWQRRGARRGDPGARPRRRARVLVRATSTGTPTATVPRPALSDALAWCRAHRPASDPPASLLWGDVRLGNVIFDADRRPAAVLDWEMTTIGAAEHDLAWYLTLERDPERALRPCRARVPRPRRGLRALRGAGRPVAPSRWSGSRSSPWCAASRS